MGTPLIGTHGRKQASKHVRDKWGKKKFVPAEREGEVGGDAGVGVGRIGPVWLFSPTTSRLNS